MTAGAEGRRGPSAPDVVYVVGHLEGYRYDELRYSMRSLVNVDHGTVWVAGHMPRWCRNVEHIRVRPGPYGAANALANLTAAVTHGGVSSTFTLWNDDFFALRPTTVPVWYRGRIEPQRQRPNRRRRQDQRYQGLAATAWLAERWGCDEVLNYELHVPMTIDRTLMAEALDAAEPAGIGWLHPRTLYGNLTQIGGVLRSDVKIGSASRTWPDDAEWVSTSDKSFANGAVGRHLRALFPDPSPYEVV